MRTSGNRKELRIRWQARIVVAAMVAIVALAGVRIWFIRGLVRTFRVDGSSMAETLLGAHYRVTCADCGITFRCDAEHVPAERRAVCPNCGYARNALRDGDLRPGERLLVDRWPLIWRLPQRGEIVMASSPDESPWPIVKRVAGLPGERLEIRRGDLFADGRIVRKSLLELRAVATLVHDNNFLPHKSSLPPRWQAEAAAGGWQARGTGFAFQPAATSADGELAWLVYQNWPCMGGPIARTSASPVLDNDSYNQAESRQLNSVTDLLLTCRVQLSGPGKCSLAIHSAGEPFVVVLSTTDDRVTLMRGEQELARRTVPGLRGQHAHKLALAWCDQQILFAFDGPTLFRLPVDPPEKPKEQLHPLAIGAAGLDASVTDLQIWRDIYYLEPWGTGRSWHAEAAVPPRSVALLGDNPAVSIDSRHWPHGGVSVATITGIVLRPDWLASDR